MKTYALLSYCLLLSIGFANRGAAQVNVVQPGDPIILVNGTNDGDPNAGPPPAPEGVEHAIDGFTQKYLNFLDLGSGFIVTPSRGITIVTGIRFYTANDAEERDPASYTLEGSTSGSGGPWTPISSGALALPSGRNGGGAIPINSATHFNQLVNFPNSAAFTSYRVTFPTLKNAAAANSMQIGEVELLASIETAAELFVNVDALGAPEGTLNSIANNGTLGGVFEARGGGATVPTIAFAGGTRGIQFDSSDYMQLVASPGGALIVTPAGLVGPNPTRTVEVWALNPYIADEETLVAWGKRGGGDGSNMSFNYGGNGGYGAVGHWGGQDIGWNNAGGAPQSKRWHHLVYTYDGTTTRVYSDGALANTEVLGAGAINTHAGTAINLATQLEPDGLTPTPVFRGSLTIGRVRIHDGVLSDSQIQNNYNLERLLFVDPVPPVPRLLASAPVHRYRFANAPAADAAGLTLVDSIGTAHGVVRGAGTAFTGTRMALAGGPSATAGYGDLPNGLLSVNGTNNGGSGQVSIEGWVRVTGNRSWSRIFDFGSSLVGGVGAEVFGPGGGGEGRDYFMYSAQAGLDVNFHRLELRNEDPLGGGIVTFDVFSPTFNTDLHFVVTWQESTGELKVYENGNEVAQTFTDDRISDINDVNVWLGRSNWVNDDNMQGEFDEFRLYDHVLAPGEVLGNFQRGPNTVSVVPPVPRLLVLAPVHRYTFNNAPAADAAGLTLVDSIGTAHGVVRGAGTAFTGTRLTLAGGPSATAGYGDLPNGLLSVNGTNNGGSGQVSIEGWVRVTGNRNWSRYFDFGSTDIGGGVGGEVTGPGGGGAGLDYFMYSAQAGTDVNFHRLELRNEDPAGGGIVTFDVFSPTFNTDVHFVVTWQESNGELKVYENGNEVAQTFTDDRISDIHDVNVWLGRSNWVQDDNMQGEFDEFRLYDNVLTPGEVLGNFQRGPNTLGVVPPPYAAAVLADGPIAYWRFNYDEIPGAINIGTLGAAANGTYNGDAAPGAQAPRPPAFPGLERNNTALQLDGVGDFVGTMNSLMNGRPAFTISGWIRRNGTQNNRTGLWGQNDVVEFGYINNDTIQAWTDNGLDITPNPIPDGQWAHLAVVSDGSPGTLTIYTNGRPAASRPHTIPANNAFLFNIGGGGVFDDGALNGNFFNGQIDEVAVFDRALTAQQIANHYITTAPALTGNPQNAVACVGNTASFTVTWQGPASVQWQKRPPGGTFQDIPGATAGTYVTPPITPADDGAAFRALITDAGITLTSEEAFLSLVAVTTPTVTYDFNSGLPAGTAIYGSSFIDTANGLLELNPNVGSLSGAFLTADLAPGAMVNGFTATFKVRMSPGTSPPADGFSFNWATDLPFGPLALAEEGHVSGLSVCFDTFDNGGAEAPAIDVKWNGAVIAHTPVSIGFLVTGNFADVQIRLNPNGTLDLIYGCSVIHAGLPIPGFTPLRGARFGLASRTGGLWETHTIDDLALQLNINPADVPRITSIARQVPSGLIINGTGTPGANLALQASSNLVDWAWRAYVTPDINGLFQFVEADITTPPYRFYRLASGAQFPAGLVTWWRGENNHTDSFGPNHGSPFMGTGPSFAAGQRGRALSFNGTTEAMLIGAAPIPVPWTACFWVNRQDAVEASAALLTDPGLGLKLEQWQFTRQVGFTAFGVADYYFNYIVPANVWTHLTFVGSPGGTIIYANGTAVETNAATISLPMNILGVRENNFDHMQGQLDETTIFNRALSPAEIQRVINATRGP